MPILPRGRANNRPGTAGFTLIELLAVVTIMAILSLGVGLSIGGGFTRSSDSAQGVADRFTDSVAQARDIAILGRVPVGLRLQSDGWSLVRRDVDGNWAAITRPVITPQTRLMWLVEGRTYAPPLGAGPSSQTPAVMFLPEGRNTVASLVIAQGATRLTCDANGWGAVECR